MVEFAGKPVKDSDSLVGMVVSTKPGTSVPLVVFRDNQRKSLNVVVGELTDRYRELEFGLTGVYDAAVAHCRPGASLAELDRPDAPRDPPAFGAPAPAVTSRPASSPG